MKLDLEKLLEDHGETIKSSMVHEIEARIKSKIQYDSGLGTILGDWIEKNVAPEIIKFLDNNKKDIVKSYLEAYEKAMNLAMEERAEKMVKNATGYAFQKALKEL